MDGENSMVVLARRVFPRPKLDEECPEWARDLLACAEQEHGLGIPYDRIPQATLEDLEYFFPVPIPPKRQRRIGSQQVGNKYARTSGLAVFLACLPYAVVKQLELFGDAPGVGTGEVAVLGFRKLADLAKKIGMSYDRLQRHMTILITLGFIWRFRDGKRTLYVIPLATYAPRPSVEGVRTKLTALIHSQFVEVEQADGQVVRADRCPEFTNLLLEIRARFELRYQLAPSLDLDLVEDPAWENTLRDIQQALPGLTRADLYTILPIIARQLLQQGGLEKGRHFVLKRNTIESTLSIEAISARERKGASQSGLRKQSLAQKNGGEDGRSSATESPFDDQTLHMTADIEDTSAAEPRAQSQESGADRIGVKRRFDPAAITTRMSVRTPSQAALLLSDDHAANGQNLPLPAGSPSFTSGSPAQDDALRDGTGVNGKMISGQEQDAKQESWTILAAEIAPIFDDQKSLKFYEGVCRSTEEPLVRAIFIKTLYQGQNGGFTRSAGAYFKFMWEQWRVYKTYAAACAKWNHWGNKREPKGVPPKIQKLVTLYEHDSYSRVASCMGYAVPQLEQESWLPEASIGQGEARLMTLEEAQNLVEVLCCYASWYLRDPQVYQEIADVPEAYVVDALWQDGQETTYTTFDEWLDIHRQMLTLPEEIDAWFEAERTVQQERRIGEEAGMSAQDREDRVHAALAMYAYHSKDATVLSWEDLVALGRPLLGKRVEPLVEDAGREEPADLITEEGQLYVRLDDGDLVPVDDYQRAYALQMGEQWQEEEECTYEGALAVLQCEFLLGLHLGVLRTFGLSAYLTFVASCPFHNANGAVPGAEGASEETLVAVDLEENSVADACSGMLLAMAWVYLRRLRHALDPRFYQVRWQPVASGTCCIVVASQLSGQTYLYDGVDQVEQALVALSAVGAEEAPEC